MTVATPHRERKEIARFVLARGAGRPDHGAPIESLTNGSLGGIPFPDSAPAPRPIVPEPDPASPLPQAGIVVITWTVDEARALAHVFTPGVSIDRWHRYAHRFAEYLPQIRAGAPARAEGRLGSYMPLMLGAHSVLCMKSELHLNQDGIGAHDAHGHAAGTATLPVKQLFQQIAGETGASLILTIGTAGSVYDEFGLGDVVITRAARFKCEQEFRNEPFNGQTYTSDWDIPTARFAEAEALMAATTGELAEPPVGPPSPGYPSGLLDRPGPVTPRIRLDGAPPLPKDHPILTTDYFEYGTTVNRLDALGAGVEMGDAALGLAVSELPAARRPRWAVIRNMSDPVINGDLPAKQFHLNEQTTWAVAFYTAYGLYTSINGAIATWAVIAAL